MEIKRDFFLNDWRTMTVRRRPVSLQSDGVARVRAAAQTLAFRERARGRGGDGLKNVGVQRESYDVRKIIYIYIKYKNYNTRILNETIIISTFLTWRRRYNKDTAKCAYGDARERTICYNRVPAYYYMFRKQ